jgi:hypothetical protein
LNQETKKRRQGNGETKRKGDEEKRRGGKVRDAEGAGADGSGFPSSTQTSG